MLSPFSRRDAERDMKLRDWLQHLPPRMLLSYYRRLAKLRCGDLASRLVAETGSDILDGIDAIDAACNGPVGPTVTDVRGPPPTPPPLRY